MLCYSIFSVPVCPHLDIPHSFREVDYYTAGGSITITGCAEGYTLEGTVQYTCVVQDGMAQWQPTLNTQCKGITVKS